MWCSRSRGPRAAGRLVASGLALLLTHAGCRVEPRELDEQQCSDDDDNDGDDLVDCLDPDCHAHAFCYSAGREIALGPGSGSDGPDAAGVGDGPITSEAGVGAPHDDAASPSEPALPPAWSLSDAGPSGSLDADQPVPSPSPPPLEPDPCAGEVAGCAAPPECQGEGCLPTVMPPNVRITEITVEVPKQTSYTFDNEADCVDPDSQCGIPIHLPPFLLCGCSPDPFVRVLVDGYEVGRTPASINNVVVRWSVAIDIALQLGNELRFEVMDRDLKSDQLVYTCRETITEEVLAEGVSRCERFFTTDTGRRSFEVRAQLESLPAVTQ